MLVLDRFQFRGVLAAVSAGVLVGCSTTSGPPREVYTQVKVPVPVSCVPKDLDPRPLSLRTPADLLAIPDGPERYVAMAQDWLARVERMNDTEPVVRACQQAAPAP